MNCINLIYHRQGRFFVRADDDPNVIDDFDDEGIMRLSITVGADISSEQIVGIAIALDGEQPDAAPEAAHPAAARKLEGLATGIDMPVSTPASSASAACL